jgi:hypothetical protein
MTRAPGCRRALIAVVALLSACHSDAGPLQLRGHARATGDGVIRAVELTGEGRRLRIVVTTDPAAVPALVTVALGDDDELILRTATPTGSLRHRAGRRDVALPAPTVDGGTITLDVPVVHIDDLRVPFPFSARVTNGPAGPAGSFPGR